MSGADIPSQPVQEKISCVYVTGVTNEPSTKRSQQGFKVTATGEITAKALSDDISTARPTEKLDGTCCLIDICNDQPWLWARHDRKPNKSGERKRNQHKKAQHAAEKDQSCEIVWEHKDFKEVPANWKPASRLEIKDGFVQPDSIGHTPGWVPVDPGARQHVWHLSCVDFSLGVALVLRQLTPTHDLHPGDPCVTPDPSDRLLVIRAEPLSNLIGRTCELIGTNINANPYGLGSRAAPLHLLTPHGDLSTVTPDPSDLESLTSWLTSDSPSAQIEGVVWHCANGQLHKVHRHHLDLPWPVAAPHLSHSKVKVDLDLTLCENAKTAGQKGGHNLFAELQKLNGQSFESLIHLCEAMTKEEKVD